MNLDLSKTSDPDCNPVVVLKNCELELSYILAELFNKCKRSVAKSYHTVSFLSVVSKVFEELVNNRFVDHLEKCDLFSDF